MLLLTLATATSWAAVTGVTTSPSSANMPHGRSASFAVVWSVTTNTAGPVTVSSAQGQFLTPSAVNLKTNTKSLSKSASGPTTVRIRETVLVPSHVILRARKLGFNKLVYRRSFTDGGPSSIGEITLNIVTPMSAGFSISRLSLLFDDEALLRVISRDDKIQAQAQLTVVGSGFFKAIWEVADPTTSSNKEPVFRPLRQVQRYIIAKIDPEVLKSPELPTNQTGQYLVRLRIIQPEPGFDIPVLRYFVGTKKAEK